MTTKIARVSFDSVTLGKWYQLPLGLDNVRDFGADCPLKWNKTSFSFDCTTTYTDPKIALTSTTAASMAGTLSPDAALSRCEESGTVATTP